MARFEVQCTEPQLNEIKAAAAAAGYTDNVSAWIVARLCDGPTWQIPTEETLPIREAATMLGVSRQTVYMWIKKGKIRAWSLPGGQEVALADLQKDTM